MRSVIFISESFLKGKKRVISVLDRYAVRTGSETWMTTITEEGLEVVKKTLKSIATKQVHVSCFMKREGENKLIFSIGKPLHREGAAISVHQHKKKKVIFIPEHIKIATLINRIAGLFHDLGKMNLDFQKKISMTEKQITQDRSVLSDNVRHELISYFLFYEYVKDLNISFDKAWENAEYNINQCNNNKEDINKSISSCFDLIGFLILTHHKIPTNKIRQNEKLASFSLNRENQFSNYFKNKEVISDVSISCIDPSAKNLEEILKEIIFLLKRVNKKQLSVDPDYWFGMSYICRSSLILADHEQSSISLKYDIEVNRNVENKIYANTHTLYKNNRRYFNQELSWHLKHVSERSSQLTFEISNMKGKGLNNNTINSILQKTNNERFSWQNKSIDFMSKHTLLNSQGIIFNIAGTGRGKTRSNVSTLAALNKNRDDQKPFRFSTLLNLKTLTIQTIDAYSEQLKIPKNEMVGIIGDRPLLKLNEDLKNQDNHEINVRDFLDSDEINLNESEDFDDTEIISFDTIDTPEFLDVILEKSVIKNNKKTNISNENKNSVLIASPVLVSTIDFMINAGDISKNKKHSLAMIRLMQSDLILDEIDSYEPTALVSVARIIMLAAFFGNNVILSSATLSESCADFSYKAYQKGLNMRKKLLGNKNISSFSAIIDDRIPVSSVDFQKDFNFSDFYSDHLNNYFQVKTETLKRGKILRFERNKESAFEAILTQVKHFHNDFNYKLHDKNVSFGLIRIANINQAVEISKMLCENLGNKVRVCCYHSQLTTLHRFYVEKNLDFILSRKNDINMKNSELLKNIIDKEKESPDIIFIVVATPVEEIGRDHDFDWCICEPSSTQSIVQTAGRVNRHREIVVKKENFAILEFNFRAIRGEDLVFSKPGLDELVSIEVSNQKKSAFSRKRVENKDMNYTKYLENIYGINNLSMTNLIDENLIKQGLDASLKFSKNNEQESHIFSRLDNVFMKHQLKDAYSVFFKDNYLFHFNNQAFYEKFSLRGYNGENIEIDLVEKKAIYKGAAVNVKITKEEGLNNSFLNPINDEKELKKLKRVMIKNGVNYNVIKITMFKSEDIINKIEKYLYHKDFGLYK